MPKCPNYPHTCHPPANETPFGVTIPLDGSKVRVFGTGATRDVDTDKPDYEGYLSPLVIERFGQYMTKHRHQSDGNLRASDNWQKGIPFDVYMKSAWRHFMDWWRCHRDDSVGSMYGPGFAEEALCALLFNVQGYLHELLKRKGL
jgi:hypothetical protein